VFFYFGDGRFRLSAAPVWTNARCGGLTAPELRQDMCAHQGFFVPEAPKTAVVVESRFNEEGAVLKAGQQPADISELGQPARSYARANP
jgi:hypothetical protein